MKTLHKFWADNKDQINKSFNTFKKWITEIEELNKHLEVITLNDKKKYFIKNEFEVLNFFKKFN